MSTCSPVADGVDLDLHPLQVAVDQDRAGALLERGDEVAAQLPGVLHDPPSPGRPARRRGGPAPGSRSRRRSEAPPSSLSTATPGGCGIESPLTSASKRRRSSAMSIDSGEEPATGSAGPLQDRRHVDRGLPPELHDRGRRLAPLARLVAEQVAHGLPVQRLEVEAVGGVEVRRDGLGVGVGEDRLRCRPACSAWAACTEQ